MMNNSTDDQQTVINELTDLVLQRIFTRIAPQLSEEDVQKFESLSKEDTTGALSKDFLVSKVPNFDQIFQEEIDLLKSGLGSDSK